MKELKERFPEGLDYAIVYDTTPFINESVNEVFKTLRDAVILVAVVVLLFLQNWRSAMIPLVAVPVAIVGTFAVMAALGFSLNNLTLFGLVLAIGIVVDDAIVVVEAVEHHIEHGLAPREATIMAMDQVSGAGRSPSAWCSRAVFVPVRVHHGDHRPVLPPVRADDRDLDGHLGVQLADAQPGAVGPAAAAETEGRVEALPWLAFVGVGGWLGYALLGAVVVDRAGSRADCPALPVRHDLSGSAGTGRWRRWSAGWSASAESVLGWTFCVVQHGLRRGDERLHANGRRAAAGQRARALGLRRPARAHLLELHRHADRLHPRAGQGLPAGQRAVARFVVGASGPSEVMKQIEQIARKLPGVQHTVAIAGQSILLNANAPNFGAMYVMLDDFHHRARARALRRR